MCRGIQPMHNSARFGAVIATLFAGSILLAEPATQPAVKSESFNQDPGWEAFQNRVVPKAIKAVAQNFGYSDTNFAGAAKGEIGGTIWRSSTPASYAAKI